MPCEHAACAAGKAAVGFARAAKYSRDRKILQTPAGTPPGGCHTSSPSGKSLRRRTPQASEVTGTFIAKPFAKVLAKALRKTVHESSSVAYRSE
jgi:hypothetical protein